MRGGRKVPNRLTEYQQRQLDHDDEEEEDDSTETELLINIKKLMKTGRNTIHHSFSEFLTFPDFLLGSILLGKKLVAQQKHFHRNKAAYAA